MEVSVLWGFFRMQWSDSGPLHWPSSARLHCHGNAHQKFQEKQREVDEDILYVSMLRRLISITTLLQHYVEEKAVLKSFLLAHLCSGMGKRFPCTVQNLYSMIVERRFHGVDLHTFTDLPGGTICTTPRCVCRALCAAPRGEKKKDKKKCLANHSSSQRRTTALKD